ncbi:MAG TPA: class I SAM-dependent methyltransferase, partial [Chitinophagaceae bacterium]|nr:class I SAM-dependent methyltransferase [Chitinophagaceae bacterium]
MATYPEHKECLISGSANLKPVKGYEKFYLVKSKPVGFVFCSRIPTVEELIAHYNTYSREDYLSPVTIKRYHELLDGFEPYRKTGRILDIGCGIGFFLSVARERGWEVYGTEYTDAAIAKCREKGIRMQQGKLDPTWYPEGHFDIITSFEVIEHINNPKEEIGNIRRLLRKGGLFYFTTPNFNALERYMLKAEYNILHYPEHLSYYTKRTIHYLLSHNGFTRKKLITTGISITRIKTSLKVSKENFVSSVSADEKMRVGL